MEKTSVNDPKVTKIGSGQILFRQGEAGGTLYFIQKGKVELKFRDERTGDTAVIATVGENSVLGVMSFLENEERSATGTVVQDVECVIVNQAQRERLLKQVPNWFRVLVKDLSSSLRVLNQKYTTLENKCSHLETQLKAYQKKTGKDDAEQAESSKDSKEDS